MEACDKYLESVVIPYYKNTQFSNGCWALRNRNHEFIAFSDNFAEQFRENSLHLTGKSLSESNAVKSEFFELERELDDKVWQNPDELYSQIEMLQYSDGSELPLMVHRSAIKQEGKIIAVEAKYYPLNDDELNLSEYKKVDRKDIKRNKKFNIGLLSNREKMIIFLLIIRKTQQEIAALYSISRCRVAQIIASICDKCNIPGVSAKLLVDYALSYNLHKQIPLKMLALIAL
jgi:hypothetical protein